MKANGTQILVFVLFVQLVQLISPLSSLAQRPDYDFSNGTLTSGMNRRVNSTYRYSNVKTGVDAIVTITALTGGVTLNDVDGIGSGFREAFQPVIQVPAHSSGYAEFNISFVLSNTIIPAIMLEVPITPIDVDGRQLNGGKVFEFDQINWGLGIGSYLDYNLLGGELGVTLDPQWLTGRNTAGIDYPGVDTSAKQAMFTVVVPSIPSIVVRVGADNQGNNSEQRLRSIYFKKFNYPFSYLARPALNSFRGTEKDSKVNLQWQLGSDNTLKTVVVERATAPAQFSAIGEVWVNTDGVNQKDFRFNDNVPVNGQAYYRLKMIGVNGVVEYSNVLVFRSATAAKESFKVYPSVIQSSATVNVRAEKSGSALFQLVDYSGRVILQQNMNVQEGDNNILVNSLDNIRTGNYVALVKTSDNKIHTQKIVKQ